MNLFTGLLERGHDGVTSSPEQVSKTEQGNGYHVFDALASEDTRTHFHGTLLVTLANSGTVWEGAYIGSDQGSLGPCQRLATMAGRVGCQRQRS